MKPACVTTNINKASCHGCKMSLYLLLDLTSELWTGCQCMSFVEHYHFFGLVLLVLSLGKVGSSRLLGSQLVRKVRVVS